MLLLITLQLDGHPLGLLLHATFVLVSVVAGYKVGEKKKSSVSTKN